MTPFQSENLVHLPVDVFEVLEISGTDFRRRPAGIADFGERFADTFPVDISLSDRNPAGFAAPAFDIEFDDARSERPGPFSRIAVFSMIADVEMSADPWGTECIDVSG